MEEIIIDGVNVAGCDYMYDNEDLNYMCQNGIGTCICRENKNCYYKQLKRLEFELKVTKADYEASEQENAELKAENEKLKAEIKNNKSAYQVELGAYNMECGNLLEENNQLLQTLQEIKEIIHEQLMWQGQLPLCELEILQKITEAEEE